MNRKYNQRKRTPSDHQKSMQAWVVGLIVFLVALFAALFYFFNKWVDPASI